MPPKTAPKAAAKASGKPSGKAAAAKAPNSAVAKLKMQMQLKREAEEKAKKMQEEEEARIKEELRLAELERRAEEEERKAMKEEHKAAQKAAKKDGKKNQAQLALERMAAAGMIVPDKDKIASSPVQEMPKPKPKKAHVDPAASKPKEEPADGLCDDWEAQMELEERREEEDKARQEKEEAEAAAANAAKDDEGSSAEQFTGLRSPICCVLGHVDTGKTSLLDKIRSTNVQGGEAGGITQQIGATFFPREAIVKATAKLNERHKHELRVPGLLVIDTPGHESFTNLRTRGSSLCDIAVLVVDIMHGLEPQTKESIRLLKERKCPFIVALNKVDRLLDWEPVPDQDIETSLARQKPHVISEYDTRVSQVLLEFAQEGLNAELYYKNNDVRKYVSVVPTSAKSGEGICDLLLLETQLVQRFMEGKVSYRNDQLECTVLEVKPVIGIGTTIDVVLVNGELHEGQRILVCGINGPILTQIRSLLTPQPMRELRVKAEYVHHQKIHAAMGVKIAATDLDEAVPGTPLYVVKDGDDVNAMKKEVMKEVESLFNNVEKFGVTVQSSTLGSLEALLSFLKDMKIPVSSIALGPLHKRHLNTALAMKDRNPRYAIVLAFDVSISKEAQDQADKNGIRIFNARIIYHLFDSFKKFQDDFDREILERNRQIAIFPAELNGLTKIRNKDPIICGAHINRGQLHIGTPLCVMHQGIKSIIGRVASLEKDGKEMKVAKRGADVAVKIVSADPNIAFGRHIDEKSVLTSSITRESVDALKDSFRGETSEDDWFLMKELVVAQKIPPPKKKPAAPAAASATATAKQ